MPVSHSTPPRFLLVEVDGLVDDLELQAERVLEACRAANVRELRLAKDDVERAKLWKGRKQAFGAFGRMAPNAYVLDGVIPRTKLPDVLREIVAVAARRGLVIANVFHAGDGNLHPTILYDERPAGRSRPRARGERRDLEPGDRGRVAPSPASTGLASRRSVIWARSSARSISKQMRSLRSVFDPRGLCNPGKVIPAPGQCVEPGRSHRKLPLGH
jgi:glycolate oxidase